jgi:Protein of unknown function (DUF1566)
MSRAVSVLLVVVAVFGVRAERVAAQVPSVGGVTGPQGGPRTNATRPDPPCFDNVNRYVNCNNGTVTDTVTGLIWLQQADCISERDYASANNAAALLASGQCGLNDHSVAGDWRLPTKDEWTATTLYLGCTNPKLTNDAGTACFGDGTGSSFTGVASAVYWSSSSAGDLPSTLWAAFLTIGGPNLISKDDATLRVWPVRGGPR